MRARISGETHAIVMSFAAHNSYLHGKSCTILSDNKQVLFALEPRNKKGRGYVGKKTVNCPMDAEWPWVARSGSCNEVAFSRFAPIEIEGRLEDDVLVYDLPPIHDRPWPQFKSAPGVDPVKAAGECLIERVNSLKASGCPLSDIRARLRLTDNAKNHIPSEAWIEAQQIMTGAKT